MSASHESTSVTGADTPIRWIDREDDFTAMLEQLRVQHIVALDTEFHRERSYFPHLALVQLAWDPGQLVLIDPLAVDITPLGEVLASKDVTTVIHASSQDLEVLRLATGTIPANLFDTQIAAGFVGFANPSLATLHTQLLDVHLDKGDRLTDWMARPLRASVLSYAAGDVRYLLRIKELLEADLTKRGRLTWATEECATARERSLVQRDPNDAWKRVKEVRRLSPKAQGVARSIARWREARAAELDLPVRFVLGDLALVGIAQRIPDTASSLRTIRGVDARSLNDATAKAVLDAVARGLEDGPPPKEVPTHPKMPKPLRPAVALLSSWLAQFAGEVQIDAQVIATRTDIEAFVADPTAGRLGSGWRNELVGDAMSQLLDGRAALTFSPEHGIVLEPRVVTSPIS